MNDYPEDFPEELSGILDALILAIGALFIMLLNERLTVLEWQAEMEGLLARYHTAAYMLGVDTEVLSQFDLETIDTFYQSQLGYLAAFTLEMIAAGVVLETMKARAEMYAGAICAPYWMGKTKGLNLPAYPSDGSSECKSNDRCSLSINTLDAQRGDYDVFWVLDTSITDHCDTCKSRSTTWNPLLVRSWDVVGQYA